MSRLRWTGAEMASYYSSSRTGNHIACNKVPQAGPLSMTQLWRLCQEKRQTWIDVGRAAIRGTSVSEAQGAEPVP